MSSEDRLHGRRTLGNRDLGDLRDLVVADRDPERRVLGQVEVLVRDRRNRDPEGLRQDDVAKALEAREADRVGRLALAPRDGQDARRGRSRRCGSPCRARARSGARRTRARAGSRPSWTARPPRAWSTRPGPPADGRSRRRGEEGVRRPTRSHGDGARPCGRSGACARSRRPQPPRRPTRAKSPKATPAPTLSNHGTTVPRFEMASRSRTSTASRIGGSRIMTPRYQKRMITSTGMFRKVST